VARKSGGFPTGRFAPGSAIAAGAALLLSPLLFGCSGLETGGPSRPPDRLSERILEGQRVFVARVPPASEGQDPQAGGGWFVGTVRPEIAAALASGRPEPAVTELHHLLRRGIFDRAAVDRVFEGRTYGDAEVIAAVAAHPPAAGQAPPATLVGWAFRDRDAHLDAFNKLPGRRGVVVQWWDVEREWFERVYGQTLRG
jgi:hypothetical protein